MRLETPTETAARLRAEADHTGAVLAREVEQATPDMPGLVSR